MVQFDCSFSGSGGSFPTHFVDATERITLEFVDSSKNIGMNFGTVLEVEKDVEVYTGDYSVVPDAHEAKVLNTENKKLLNDVTVSKVPYYETSNDSGNTIYIASVVN